MATWTHRTIIVPAAFQQLAQGLCAAAAEGDAGKGMFTTGLSATGALPATHYISSGYIFDDFAALLPLTTVEPSTDDGEPDMVTERPGNVAFVEGLAAQAAGGRSSWHRRLAGRDRGGQNGGSLGRPQPVLSSRP